MYIRGEREKEGEEMGSRMFCSKLPHRSCHLADTVGPEAVSLWDVLYFCHELSASESIGEREAWYQSRKPLTKGPASCLTANESICIFGLCLPSTARNVLCPCLLPRWGGDGERWDIREGLVFLWRLLFLMAKGTHRSQRSPEPALCLPSSHSHSPPWSRLWDSSSVRVFPLSLHPETTTCVTHHWWPVWELTGPCLESAGT